MFTQANEKFNVTAALECNNENGVPQLECITPLRLLLESERSVDRWNEEVSDLEAHNKIRCQKTQWKSDHVNIVDYLRKRLKLDRYVLIMSLSVRPFDFVRDCSPKRNVCLSLRRFSEERIHTACGILDVNTFEVRTAKGYGVRGIYPTVAMMNHSCVSNTSHTISPINFRYVVDVTSTRRDCRR